MPHPLFTVELDIEAVPFQYEKSRELVTQWQALRKDASVPYADEINPASMKSLLPEIIIFEVPNINTIRYRLTGTEAVKRLGFEPRGMNLFELIPPNIHKDVRHVFAAIVRLQVGILAHYAIGNGDTDPIKLEMVLLPLQVPTDQPARVISLSTRAQSENTLHDKPEVRRFPNHIEGAVIFDIGFGIPDNVLEAYFD